MYSLTLGEAIFAILDQGVDFLVWLPWPLRLFFPLLALLWMVKFSCPSYWPNWRAAAERRHLYPVSVTMRLVDWLHLAAGTVFGTVIEYRAIRFLLAFTFWWLSCPVPQRSLGVIGAIFLLAWPLTILVTRILVKISQPNDIRESEQGVMGGVFLILLGYSVWANWNGTFYNVAQAPFAALPLWLLVIAPFWTFWKIPPIANRKYGDATFADQAELKSRGIIDER